MGLRKGTHRWLAGVSPIEGRMWRVLVLACGNVVTYDEIARRVWADEATDRRHNVSIAARSLRRNGVSVQCVRGVGFRLACEDRNDGSEN